MNIDSFIDLLTDSTASGKDEDLQVLASYINKLNLWPKLLRRQQEEEILKLVPICPDWLDKQRVNFLGDNSLDSVLQSNNWSPDDLDVFLSLPEALRLFAEYQFSPGLEELFLSADGGHDQVIYSLLRVRDPGLAQELWIRLEEGESSFSELASRFGEGPESSKKGLLGPLPIGSIEPAQLRTIIRSLSVSKVSPPIQLGEWIILVRLEQLTQARFDDKMRSFLIRQELNKFLDQRVENLLQGQSVDPLQYHQSL